jgi:regulator of protease activity HflC (stomatin/prohibitin superfamily)
VENPFQVAYCRGRSITGGTAVFNIGYFKGQPTDYVIRYSGGKVADQGPGLAFFYLRYKTQVVAVPTSSADADFVFNETTNNFQAVTIQGQFTYRIADPKKVASLLNFAIDPHTRRYLSDDPDKLERRISNVIQIETRSEIQRRTLEETLRDAQGIAAQVLPRLRENVELATLGVELLSVYFLSTKPTPEVAQALEAEYREQLLRKADEATYARRAAAVDEERKIKEKELATERALEEQRRELIVRQGENAKQEAGNRAAAVEIEAQGRAKAAELEWAVVRGIDPRLLVASGMNKLGENAEKIDGLTITTELLASLLNGPRPG